MFVRMSLIKTAYIMQISMNVLSVLTTAMPTLRVPILLDLSRALATQDLQEME